MNEPEISIQDIAKKFDLPERKSKIDTLLKLQDVKKLRYCFCRSTDITRFMICCEKCDEWYHGDCVGLAEKDAKCIKRWYCSVCIDKFGLEIVYSSSTRNTSPQRNKNKKKKKSKTKIDCSISTHSQCGKCSNCLQNLECGNKDFIFKSKHTTYHKCGNGSSTKHSLRCMDELHKRTSIINPELRLKQCNGPNCLNPARKNSKYCSDDCGLALAKMRLISILPHRIMERIENPCIADKLDQSRLENVRAQKAIVAENLKNLEIKKREIINLIARAKRLPIDTSLKLPNEDSKMYCISCGYEIPVRTANRHMATCFKKFESLTEVVAASKTTNCDIFCDFYDAVKKTYCKRFRFSCPDHNKSKKIDSSEVCGCPLIEVVSRDLFTGAEKYCQQPKKTCDHHYNWDVLEISQIDLQKYHQLYKYDLLAEEEIVIKKRIVNRTGALGLLLHSTQSVDY